MVIDLLLRNSSQECRAHSVMLRRGCDQYDRYQPQGVKNPVNLHNTCNRMIDHDKSTNGNCHCRRGNGRWRAGAGAGAAWIYRYGD
ncbi:hypothetical protein C3424_09330 [Citrobacter amalonaticus]|nr:hypothetical protein C3436_02025 [Citrobacter amalonaticus]POV05520.1 hypothetical protein C3424_09330 [Citrobacter amalonaticus]